MKNQSLNKEYEKPFTDLVEIVYGDNFLSQDGREEIDKLFENEVLTNKKLLDIGSGLGEVDFYLASKYSPDITNIDRVERLINDANSRNNNESLKGNINFSYKKHNTRHK